MYYIVPKDAFTSFAKRRIAAAHYIDLPDGSVLVKVQFVHEGAQAEFEAHPQITTLPHPMSGESVGEAVAAKLAHIGVTKDHRTYDVAKLAARISPMMKLR